MEHVTEKQPPAVLASDTDNATIIKPTDAPHDKRQKYEHFRAYNTNTWNGPRRENKEVTYRQDNLHRYDAIASHIGLTGYQKSRGRNLFDSLHLRKLGLPLELVVFAVCVLVANADSGKRTRYWPLVSKKDNDEQFLAFGDELGFSLNQQLSAVMKLKSRTNL